jgi:hypothetical protein
MRIYKTILLLFLGLIFSSIFVSCNSKTKTSISLSKTDIAYIKNLGILENNETIILFDTQGAFGNVKVSGNFFTEKRIASYWIDKNDTCKNDIYFAYYSDIDTITATFLTTSLTYTSYLEVQKNNGQKFKVFVDADSAETSDFFNCAIAEWIKNKKKYNTN